jgi:hypothetical protein
MKKILTIATVALLSTLATAAHADTVNFPGSVASSCTLAVTDGSLDAATTAVGVLSTATSGNANVICNSGSNLAVALGTGSVTHGATPRAFFWATGGNGIYANVTNASSFSSTDITKAAGDDAKIGATITAATGALLPAATDYKVVADVTLTAQ